MNKYVYCDEEFDNFFFFHFINLKQELLKL